MMKKAKKHNIAIATAILAAVLYGVNAPFAKLLLEKVPALLLAALLYLGAGIGMAAVNLLKTALNHKKIEASISRKELMPVIGMILLDIAAPILLMIGLSMTNASNVSLLNNFEIVATSVIALAIYKEAVGRRMWVAIFLITLASFVLSIDDIRHFSFSIGSFFVVGACICWGFENNLTRVLSEKDPMQVVVIKGFGSGIGALIIALFSNEYIAGFPYILLALLLGFVAYGLSIFFYVTAQRNLGAARTSIYYSAAPFIGVIASWIILREELHLPFFIGLAIMIAGTYFAVSEKHKHTHIHDEISHDHRHSHEDGHHTHAHSDMPEGEHSHEHTHKKINHKHIHTPDLHHRHDHKDS
ncbi:MAG: EamA family transporter [Clostridia bacterium]|nr:EamA family transporter [Clostridia bacterium]